MITVSYDQWSTYLILFNTWNINSPLNDIILKQESLLFGIFLDFSIGMDSLIYLIFPHNSNSIFTWAFWFASCKLTAETLSL